MARKYEIAIVGTIVHGTHSKLECPSISPFDVDLDNGHQGTVGGEAGTSRESSGLDQWTVFLRDNHDALSQREDFELINEAFYLDKDGVKGRYHKLNLWHPER